MLRERRAESCCASQDKVWLLAGAAGAVGLGVALHEEPWQRGW